MIPVVTALPAAAYPTAPPGLAAARPVEGCAAVRGAASQLWDTGKSTEKPLASLDATAKSPGKPLASTDATAKSPEKPFASPDATIKSTENMLASTDATGKSTGKPLASTDARAATPEKPLAGVPATTHILMIFANFLVVNRRIKFIAFNDSEHPGDDFGA
jgi:hypothetical protein